jgi:hypothetical protein
VVRASGLHMPLGSNFPWPDAPSGHAILLDTFGVEVHAQAWYLRDGQAAVLGGGLLLSNFLIDSGRGRLCRSLILLTCPTRNG